MPLLEEAKKTLEMVTGLGRPARKQLGRLINVRKVHKMRFKDDGKTPNNPRCPVILYRSPVKMNPQFDMASVFEELFKLNGWENSWRDGMYDYLHFHTHTHEVLGVARGTVTAEIGGAKGSKLKLKAGDVIILPAGTGHRMLRASKDLLIVGAYPANGGKYDEPRPEQLSHKEVITAIARVRAPRADPIYGKDGPLKRLWRAVH